MTICKFCGSEAKNKFFCSCGEILSLCWDNEFKALDLPVSFDIDLFILRQNYYAKLKMLHPDQFHFKTEEQKILSQKASSFLNRAYNKLKDPWERAELLLSIHEFIDNTPVAEEILLEVMEISDIQCRDKRISIIKQKETELLDQLQNAFSNNDLATASKIIIHFRFIRKASN